MLRLATILVCGLGLAACASITRGTSETMRIQTDPPGATARTSLGYGCVTPCAFPVGRKDEFTVVIAKPGYETETVSVRTQVGGGGAAGVAGNVILGGVTGIVVDVATGAALDHCPNPVAISLRPAGKPGKSIMVAPPPEQLCHPPAEQVVTGPRYEPTVGY